MRKYRLFQYVLLAFMITMFAGGVALAAGPVYEMNSWTVDGGGAIVSEGGNFKLGGSIGQPDAGAMSGGDFKLGGGFWGGGALSSTSPSNVYLPIVIKN